MPVGESFYNAKHVFEAWLPHGGSITDRTKQTLNRACRAGAYRHDIGCKTALL